MTIASHNLASMADVTVPLYVRNMRLRAGFPSQQALADEMGIKRSAIGNWESGRGVPSMAHAERFAVVVNRPRAEVLAKFGYPIGGGEPLSPPQLPEEWRAAISTAVAEGIASGMAEVIARLQDEGLLPTSGRRSQRPPQRRSA